MPEEKGEEVVPEVDPETGAPIVVDEEKKESLPRNIVIDEVARESKIHFYTVPRLGSYMAIKLEF